MKVDVINTYTNMEQSKNNKVITEKEIQCQKALIGDFIITFEEIFSWIRFVILKIIFPNYNQIQNNTIEILLEGITADPLRKKLDALIHENYKSEPELQKLSKELSKKAEKLISIRNSIAHGTYLLTYNGFNGELHPDSFLLKHSKIKKEGLDKNSIIINIKTLETIILQEKQIVCAYQNLSILLNKELSRDLKETYLSYLRNDIENLQTKKIELMAEKK